MDKSTFLHSHTLEATHMRIRPPHLLSPPCAVASARPRTLRDSPRVVCGLSSPGSPPRSATAPLRVPVSSLRSEPRLLTARTLRGSAPSRLQIASLSSPPLLLRCRLGAASYPPGLAARGVWALLSGVSASLGHRSATRPGVLPPLRTPVTDCPHAPRLRPSPPPDRLSLLPASSPALPPRRGLVPSGTRRAWCVGSPLRGLRLARPPLRYASRCPPSAPNPGY